MSAISTLIAGLNTMLTTLRSAIWAIDVRDDIADAIEQCGEMVAQCYDDVSNPTLRTEALEAAVQAKIDAGEMAALTIGDGTITAAKLASGVIPASDTTLSIAGKYADSKTTGDKFEEVKADLDAQVTVLSSKVITNDIRSALLHCLESIAYTNFSAYNELYNALYGISGDIWEWDSETSDEFLYYHGLTGNTTYNEKSTINLGGINATRMTVLTSMYRLPLLDENSERYSGYNCFPVPADAGSVTVEFTPTTSYMGVEQRHFTGEDFIYGYVGTSGWKTGGKILEPINTRVATGLLCNAVFINYRLSDNSEITSNPNSVKITFHDFFDTWIFKYDSTNAGNLKMFKRAATQYNISGGGSEPTAGPDGSTSRASFYVDRHRNGQAGVRIDNSQERLNAWLIPVPDEAVSVKVTPTPATYYTAIKPYHWKEDNDTWIVRPETGWVQGVNNFQLVPLVSGYDHRYITINCKFNSSGSSGNAPTGLLVEFS